MRFPLRAVSKVNENILGFPFWRQKQPVLGLLKEAKIKSQRDKVMLISTFWSQIVQLQILTTGKRATASTAGDGGAERRRQKGRVLAVCELSEWTHLPRKSLVIHLLFV